MEGTCKVVFGDTGGGLLYRVIEASIKPDIHTLVWLAGDERFIDVVRKQAKSNTSFLGALSC